MAVIEEVQVLTKNTSLSLASFRSGDSVIEADHDALLRGYELMVIVLAVLVCCAIFMCIVTWRLRYKIVLRLACNETNPCPSQKEDEGPTVLHNLIALEERERTERNQELASDLIAAALDVAPTVLRKYQVDPEQQDDQIINWQSSPEPGRIRRNSESAIFAPSEIQPSRQTLANVVARRAAERRRSSIGPKFYLPTREQNDLDHISEGGSFDPTDRRSSETLSEPSNIETLAAQRRVSLDHAVSFREVAAVGT
eukprot:sb/3468646/